MPGIGEQKEYEVSGSVTHTDLYPANDPREAGRLFLLQHGTRPERVGSRDVLGLDEGTSKCILAGDDYTCDEDGVMLLVKEVNDLGEEDLDDFAPEVEGPEEDIEPE